MCICMYVKGNGYTVEALVGLMEVQLKEEANRRTVFTPLVSWAVGDPSTLQSLVDVVLEAVPDWKVGLVCAFLFCVSF